MNRLDRFVFNRFLQPTRITSEQQGKSTSARLTRSSLSRRPQAWFAAAITVALSVGGFALSPPVLAATVTGTAGGAGGRGSLGAGGMGGTGAYGSTGTYANSGGAGGGTPDGHNGQGANGSGGAGGTCSSQSVAASYGGGSGGYSACAGGGGGGGSLKTAGYGGGGGGGYFLTVIDSGGGGGGGGGGPAIMFLTSQTISGIYIGGAGGADGASFTTGGANGGSGGGGAGAILSQGVTLTNNGMIQGGVGGNGGASTSYGGGGGGGGGGLLMQSNSTLYNNGTITGGNGGSAGHGGGGGSGLAANGGVTITNNGAISGGKANGGSGVQADAIDLYNGGNTLIVLSSATFGGSVVSHSGTTNGGDTLELGGRTDGTLSGTFTGFTTLTKSGTSTWTVTGASGTTANAIHNWKLENGTLTVANNYNPASTDTLTAAGGELVVNGTANLNGQTLNVSIGPSFGVYRVGKNSIVHAGTLNGTFGNTNTTLASGYAHYLSAAISYTGTDAYLTLNPTQAAFTSGRGVGTSTWSTQQGLISAQQTVLNVQGGPNGAIVRVNGRPDPAVWVRGLAGTGSSDGAKLNENTALIGYGHEFLPGVVFGIALGNTDLHTKTSEQTVKTQGTGVYLYGLYNHSHVFVDATLTAGSLHTDSSRSLASAGLTATGSASGSYAGVTVNAGYRFYPTGKHLFVAPYVGAGYLHTHRNAYTESGAGLLDLTYSSTDDTLSTVSAGARVGSDFKLGTDNTLAPWMSLGETVYGGDRSVHQTVTLGSEQRVLPASGAPRSATVLDTGLTLSRGANWLTQLAYHGQYASGSHMNTADLKVVYRW